MGSNELTFRDPLTIATSKDGLNFDTAFSVMSCTNLSSTSGCSPRYRPTPTSSGGKNPGTWCDGVMWLVEWCGPAGPSYPQGLVVVDPAPKEHQGMYVVATNNKEDVWVTKLQFGTF